MSDILDSSYAYSKESPLVRNLKDFMAGWTGGIAQVIVGQPFDTIKIRLQTQPKAEGGKLPLYSGPLDCLVKTIKGEGVRGLYKGTVMPLFGVGLCVSIQFAALEEMKRFFLKDNKSTSVSTSNHTKLELTPSQLFISGTVAGLVNTVIAGPVEHIRIRLQASGAQFDGPISCIKKIYQTNGIQGIFKGQTAIMLRDGLGFGAYFLSYEYLVQHAVMKGRQEDPFFTREKLSPLQLVFSGAMAGIAFWLSVFPVDVIKSKIQTDSLDHSKRLYKGINDCVGSVWKKEGISGFFKGFTPCFLRSAPVNAATFMAFELAMRYLGTSSSAE